MPHAREFQAGMRDHSLDRGGRGGLLAALAPLSAPPAAERLSIHRNNTMIGLSAALRDAYPVVARLVGAECFDGLARAFVSAHPPAQAPLIRFGGEFPAFLAAHPVGAMLPYLADVARLEAAWLHAYHAAEAEPLDPARLADYPPERLGELCFHLHPSHRLLDSAYPVAAIWRANQGEDAAPVSLDRGGELLLVVRPEAEVAVIALSAGAFALLGGLARGETLAAAWEGALAADADFTLDSELGRLLAARVFVEVSLP